MKTVLESIEAESVSTRHLTGKCEGIVLRVCEGGPLRKVYGVVVYGDDIIQTPILKDIETGKAWLAATAAALYEEIC